MAVGANGFMSAFERRQRILSLLREQSQGKVSELAELLGVSKVTVRNDLSALEDTVVARFEEVTEAQRANRVGFEKMRINFMRSVLEMDRAEKD